MAEEVWPVRAGESGEYAGTAFQRRNVPGKQTTVKTP